MIIGVIVAIAIVVAVAVIGAVELNKRRMRESFGAEYDELVRQEGSRRAADQEIARRRRAFAKLELRPLKDEDVARFAADWRRVQESFVDDPAAAVGDADALVLLLARSKGYPGGDEETLLGLLSVPHRDAVTGYRTAGQVRRTVESDPENVSTEDLRQAFQGYGGLFNALLEDSGADGVSRPTTESASDSEEARSLEAQR
jgi:hypothetical protein